MSATVSRIADETLRAVVEAAADGIVVVDDHGTVRYANPAAHRLFDRDDGGLRGRSFGFPIEAGAVTEIEVVRDGQPHTVEMRVTHLNWDGQPAHVASLRDVTGRVQAQQALREAIALRDDVISVVGHDFRNPLAAITGAVRMLLGDQLDPGHREILQRTQQQAGQLNRLVDSLLTLSHLEGGQLNVNARTVDVLDIATRAVSDLNDAGVSIEPDIDVDTELTVHTDPDHLRQILVNYLSNADKYGDPPVHLRASRRDDGTVDIAVTDHGAGVPKSAVEQLFERFQRGEAADGPAAGSGLGLSICRRLADAAGGCAYYEPAEPTGATFGVRLPASDQAAPTGPC